MIVCLIDTYASTTPPHAYFEYGEAGQWPRGCPRVADTIIWRYRDFA